MQHPSEDLKNIESLLEFYVDAGIDCFLGDSPVDWTELSRRKAAVQQKPQAAEVARQTAPAELPRIESRAPAPAAVPAQLTARSASPAKPSNPAVIPDREVVASARDQAASAASLEELRACLEAFDGCNLKLTAKKLVFADGNPEARLMFVGEAPGRDEDLQGKPFVGRSGQLLDRMLSAIGLDRSSAYIANVVPWRPPGNRTPTPQETEICKPFIRRQIELVNPDVIVFLGAASAKNLLGVQDGIRKMRGRWMKYPVSGRDVDAIATYHPAYLLRSPLEKRLSWRDFLSIRSKLSGP
ncbi:uracil-DNA glycosylase [uncultured Roseibium sp.]|uniref:uracil-DNA glycosylase n=1 Tax=uncultured Roseibium sp. TaxID=1936171 RepID=UPI0026261B99|nr:uracil-DNA glycosylase [uncultured Roseibium sp.]